MAAARRCRGKGRRARGFLCSSSPVATNGLPRQGVESPFLEIYKSHPGQVALLEQKPSRNPFQPQPFRDFMDRELER